jgi:hypothetical protein
VTKYSWRTGTAGISSPASAATGAAQGPAALISMPVAAAPRSVRTPATAPPLIRMPVTVVRVANVTPRSRAAPA